jgi:adenine-specific DNA-methyltransferase
LKLARNLLTDDGVIFISIDDNEVENLKKIGNEIFGDINQIGSFIQNKLNSKNDTINIQKNHEYIVAYRKKTEFITNTKIKPNLINKVWKEKTIYEKNGEYYYLNDPITTRGEGGTLNKRQNLGYTIYYNPNSTDFIPIEDYDKELAKISNDEDKIYSTIKEYLDKGYIPIRPPKVRGKLGCWTWSFDKANQEKKNLIVTGTEDSYTLKKRTFIKKNEVVNENGKLLYRYYSEGNSRSVLEFSTNEGTSMLNELMDFQGAFDNPKNVKMLEYFINLISSKDFIILDFFSGSASSAHATLKANKIDNGNRKFIQIQIPEDLDETHEARIHGYKHITEIGKERIRRAGKKIVEEQQITIETQKAVLEKMVNGELLINNGQFVFPKTVMEDETAENLLQELNDLQSALDNLDTGFRVYSSNMKDVYYEPQKYTQTLLDNLDNNVKEDRTADDLLAQIMLDWGLPLSLNIERVTIEGKEVFKVAGNSLYACFDKGVDEDFAKAIAKEKPLRIVFKDSSFKDDTAKVNVKQLLQQLSSRTEMRVI